MPLPAGKWTCGVRVGIGGGSRELQACDLQGPFVLRPLAPPPSLGLGENLGVRALGRRRPGPGSRSEARGQEESVPGRRPPWAELGRGRIPPHFLIRLHVHRGVNGGLGAQ